MSIPSQQIGWSQQSKLLWQISKQLEQLTRVISDIQLAPSVDWRYSPSNLGWPVNTTDYTLYDGSWTNYDDGNATDPVPFAGEFFGNNVSETEFYLSTNGYFWTGNNNFQIYGNQQDLYLTPGDPLLDNTTQNFWYKNFSDATKWKTSILVYCGHCCGSPDQETPYSYILNIYRDTQYQYVETRIKTGQQYDGNAGINSVELTSPATIQSQVWQGDLTGTTWTYLGNGSIQ